MGVMSCHRNDCESIMCDTYVDGIGYVCYECEKEFKYYLISKSKNPQSEIKIKKNLKKFMQTVKGTYTIGTEIDVTGFFNSYRRQY